MKSKKCLIVPLLVLMFLLCACSNSTTNIQIPESAIEFDGHMYNFYLETIDWNSAKEKCESVNGHLVTITSDEENQFLVNNFPNNLISFFWIGASDEEQEGDWRWVTGEKFEYDNWSVDSPNNDLDNEHYAGIMKYEENFDDIETPIGTWNDFAEDTRYRSGFICEWEQSKTLNTGEKNILNLSINNFNSIFSSSIISISVPICICIWEFSKFIFRKFKNNKKQI